MSRGVLRVPAPRHGASAQGIFPAPGGGSLGLPRKPPRKGQGKERGHEQMRENRDLSGRLL